MSFYGKAFIWQFVLVYQNIYVATVKGAHVFMKSNLALSGISAIRKRYHWLGIGYLLIGTLLFCISQIVSIPVRLTVGAVLLILGGLICYNSFTGFRDGDKPWQQTLMAVSTLIAGLVFLFHPLSEVITVSFFMSTYFFVDGTMRLLEFIRFRAVKGSFWTLLPGTIGIIFALIAWGDFYNSAAMVRLMSTMYLLIVGVGNILFSRADGV